MRSLYAVFKREVKAYFTLPIAYVMMGGLLFIVGLLYWMSFRWFLGVSFESMRNPMMASDLDISSMVVGATISTIGVVSVFTLPLLTMRLWAEEKRTGTLELLLTFPLRDSSIVLGKFFASLAVYIVLLMLSLLYPLLAGLYARLDPGPILAGYLGTLLLGATLFAFGFLCSTWTENQIVACVLAWAGFLFFWLIGSAADFAGPDLGKFFAQLSFAKHHESFAKGVIDIGNFVFFVASTGVFLFLTTKVLESRRWK